MRINEYGEYDPPGICSISLGGGGGSKSSSTSRTRFNRDFLTQLEDYLPSPRYSTDFEGLRIDDLPAQVNKGGKVQPRVVLDAEGNPTYDEAGNPITDNGGFPASYQRQQFTMGIPRFHGLEGGDFDKLETSLYDRQQQNLTPTYERERNRRREELSQTGLLNSPVQFAEGSALDSLERNYMDQSQKSASDASIETVRLKQSELARKLGFDMSLMALIEELYGQRADLAARVGGVSTSKSSTSPTWGVGIANFGGGSNAPQSG
jgi:hypothetical protein